MFANMLLRFFFLLLSSFIVDEPLRYFDAMLIFSRPPRLPSRWRCRCHIRHFVTRRRRYDYQAVYAILRLLIFRLRCHATTDDTLSPLTYMRTYMPPYARLRSHLPLILLFADDY